MSDLQICRICLIKDVRGYKMDQYDLRRCYEQIIRGRVNEKEGLPLWFCYECAMLLYKYDKFKEKCGKGQIALRTMLWSKGISHDSIGLINRFSEAFASPIEIMKCSDRVKTSTMKHKTSTTNKKSKEPDLHYVPETNLTNFENVTLPFEEDKTFPVVNPLDKDIKVEAEPPRDDPKPDDNDFDMDNHFDNAMPSNDDDSDDNIFLNQHKTIQKPSENSDIDIDNIMNEIMSNETEVSKPEVKPKPKNGKKPVKKGYKNVYGILIPKTASDKPKAKKFETKKKDMNPEHWKKINMSEEDAMLEFKQRASSDKFLKANFKCHECFKGFSKLDMLMRHAKHYHDEACGTFVCRFCHMRFGRRWALTRHMTEHYVMYQCRRCDMQFREKSALFHDDVHNGVIRKCEHCGKEFVHSSTYYTHLRMTHRSNHICTLCGASFVSELGLLKHKRIAHYEEKDAEPSTTTSDVQEIYCDKCDIKFVSRRAYDEHLSNSNNHGESAENMKAKDFRQRKIPTMCTHCGQNFPSRQAYKKHHLSDHSQIPFDDRAICEVCGVSLSAGSVAQHMVTHTGERPYPCTMCDKRFTQKSAMKMHYRTVHLKQPYPKYPRRKPYRRKKKTEEIPQNDFTAFIRPGYYS